MRKTVAGLIGSIALVGCAGQPPTEHLAASMAAVRGAETAGAQSVPEAALHLKLAQEQIAQARTMIEKQDYERADAMTIRAFNDAELALALTREAQLKNQVASSAGGQAPVQGVKPLDATSPPGVAAPNTPARTSDD
jgi:hypothetical protein